MIIAIDFDGTCVTDEFPQIGKDIGAVPVLRKLVEHGHKLILWTVRSNKKECSTSDPNIHPVPGEYLSEAVQWFKDNGIELYGINENPDQKTWSDSPKAFADIYIDDRLIGAPTIFDPNYSNKLFIDWDTIDTFLDYIYNAYNEEFPKKP